MGAVRLMVLVLGLIVLSGCGSPKRPVQELPALEPLELTPSARLSHRLDVSLEVPSSVPHGEAMDLQLRVKNISGLPIQLDVQAKEEVQFLGAYDFEVTTPDGTKVWRWLHGKRIMLVATPKTLNPGEEMVFSGVWNQMDENGNLVEPGSYYVSGAFLVARNPGVQNEGIQTDRQMFTILN